MRQESQAIDAAFEKKHKSAETALKMFVLSALYDVLLSVHVAHNLLKRTDLAFDSSKPVNSTSLNSLLLREKSS